MFRCCLPILVCLSLLMCPKGGMNRVVSRNVLITWASPRGLSSEEPMSATMIAGGALLVAFIALIMSVVANLRSYSMHQRMLDLERRLGNLSED